MVNPAIAAALMAAVHDEDIKEKVEGRLKKERALSPASAIPLSLDAREQKLLDQALAGGTVRQTGDGRFYLNEMAVADRSEGQGFMALLILLVIASVIASVAILASLGG